MLDLCCGKGGDLRKWARAKVTHYVGVDLSPNLVQEAQRRYIEISSTRRRHQPLFKAIFMVNDAGPEDENNLLDNILTTEKKLSDIRHRIEFDLVSTQMAIHYMFESEAKLRGYLRNVTDRLRPGAYLIGTTIDADELVYRVRSSGTGNNTIQNDFMKVVLPQDGFPTANGPFALKYYFYLKEAIGKEQMEFGNEARLVDEYLVIFDVLVKFAAEYGLELVMKKNLRQYFDDMTSEAPLSFQEERRKRANDGPPVDDVEIQKSLLIPPPEVRASNRSWFEKNMSEIKQSQVLSQEDIEQQFDICSLYCVFAFRKAGRLDKDYRPYAGGEFPYGNRKLNREIINCLGWGAQ